MKFKILKSLIAFSLTASIISACSTEPELLLTSPELNNNQVNAQAVTNKPNKNYVPLQPGEGEQYDFKWLIYSGRDMKKVEEIKSKFLSFMNAHVTPSDVARYQITEPVQWYSGKHSNGGGYFLEIKLYGAKDEKLIKKNISRDLEKFLGYDKGTADSGAFALYNSKGSFLGPGIFFRW